MVSSEYDPREQEILASLDKALAADRDARSPAARAAFTSAVMDHCRRANRLKRRHLAFAALAAAALVIAAILIQPAFISSFETKARVLRLHQEKIPVLADTLTIHAPDIFQADEGERLVMLVYDYFGERCLWLYPERLIEWGEDPEADAEFLAREKWYATVTNGRIRIDPDALTATFGEDHGELILMHIGTHYEIWESDAIQRFTGESG
jgi:hypothetical protein